jgi:hypothetical protein
MNVPERELADFCEWWPEGTDRPCYAPASFVLVRPSGETLRFSCAEHLPGWAARVRGQYTVLARDEWEARGCGYRGRCWGLAGSCNAGPASREVLPGTRLLRMAIILFRLEGELWSSTPSLC